MKIRAFYAVILSAICILTTNISYAATDYSISRKVEIVLDSKRDNALSYLKSRISTINLTLNGKRVRNSDIYFRNNELMLPIRNVAEAFNLDLSWDSKTRTASLDDKAIVAKATTNDYYYSYGAMADIRLDITPEVRNGRMYVPLDFLSEVLKANVGMDGSKITVTLNVAPANVAIKMHEIAKSQISSLQDGGINNIKINIMYIGDKTGYVVYEGTMVKNSASYKVLTSKAFDIKNGNVIPITRAVSSKNMDAFKTTVEAYSSSVKLDETTNYYIRPIDNKLFFVILMQDSKGNYYEVQIPYEKVSELLSLR